MESPSFEDMGKTLIAQRRHSVCTARQIICSTLAVCTLLILAMGGKSVVAAWKTAVNGEVPGEDIQQTVEFLETQLSNAPRLDGIVPSGNEGIQHIGGFCFGYNAPALKRAPVGWIYTMLEDTVPWHSISNLYLAVYDDEPSHWQLVMAQWNTSSCYDKLRYSSNYMKPRLYRGRQGFLFEILGHVMPRHWQLVLMRCGGPSSNSSQAGDLLTPGGLHFSSFGVRSLSQWGSFETQPAKCPKDIMGDVSKTVWKLRHYLT